MLKSKPLEGYGDLKGTIFDFEAVGDGLPKHVHTPQNVHMTVVMRGEIEASSHDWSRRVKAGGIIKFRAGEPHAITALKRNTRILNITMMMGPNANTGSTAV